MRICDETFIESGTTPPIVPRLPNFDFRRTGKSTTENNKNKTKLSWKIDQQFYFVVRVGSLACEKQ
jgi:hypothetical protein